MLIRPNELLVVAAALVVALMIRPTSDGVRFGGLKRVTSLVFGFVLLGACIWITTHYLKIGTSGLSSTTADNSVYGGSGGLTYSSSPLRWPIDAYTVLFDPLPINFHGAGELAAAIENTVIAGIFIASYRQLRMLPRAMFARPYVALCLVYSVLFIYAFAALGNLGLIYRERVMLLPFLMVLPAIPRSPKGQPRLCEWEYRRKDRRAFRAVMVQRERMVTRLRRAVADGELVLTRDGLVAASAAAPALRPGDGAESDPDGDGSVSPAGDRSTPTGGGP